MQNSYQEQDVHMQQAMQHVGNEHVTSHEHAAGHEDVAGHEYAAGHEHEGHRCAAEHTEN